MTIEKIRELLGEKANKMTDEEVLKVEALLRRLARAAIDKVFSMSSDEVTKLDKKIAMQPKTML